MDIKDILKKMATPEIADIEYKCQACRDTLIIEVTGTGRFKTCDKCMKPDTDKPVTSRITGRKVL